MLSNYKASKRYHLTYSIPDFWNAYDKHCPGKLDKYEFKEVMVSFFEKMRTEIIENRYHWRISSFIGTLRIKKQKHGKKLNAHKVDWERSKKLNKIVYYLNLHTDRYYFKWWLERGSHSQFMKNRGYYTFKPVRAATKSLGKHIIECANDPGKRDYDTLT